MPVCTTDGRSDPELRVHVLDNNTALKKILYIISIALLVTGCEVIREQERLIPVDAELSTGRKHVLLEFTGYRCSGCPTAATTARTLGELYGDQLIVVAIHPASNPFTQGLYDYTCPAADSVYKEAGGTPSTGFPTGNIDFVSKDGQYFFPHEEWPTILLSAMRDTVAPTLSIEASIDTTTRIISASTFLYSDSTRTARLAVWVTEDSITGVQVMPDGEAVYDYIHRHVLRTSAFEDPWGTPVVLSQTTAPRRLSFPLPEGCNPAQCRIIALLIDTNNKHILQANETNLDFGNDLP